MPILPLNYLKPEGHMWTVHQATIPEAHTIVDLLQPDYWAHVAPSIRAWDYIHCRREDREFDVTLEVVDATRNWVKVRVVSASAPVSHGALQHVFGAAYGPIPETDETSETDETPEPVKIALDHFDIAFKGPVKKHCVIRKSDKAMIHEGCANKADAERWLKSHILALSN